MPHLRDLVKIGEVVTIEVGDVEVEIYMRKPGQVQQEDAAGKARAAQTRRKLIYQEDSDERKSILDTVEGLGQDERAELLINMGESLHQRARNEVLYSEDYGSDWGEEGEHLIGYLDALDARLLFLEEQGEEVPDHDQEVLNLRAEIDRFEREVHSRQKELEDIEKRRIAQLSEEEVVGQLTNGLITTESNLAWYQEYMDWMLYYACRDPENNAKSYFKNITEMRDMPEQIISQIRNRYENLSLDGGDLKN